MKNLRLFVLLCCAICTLGLFSCNNSKRIDKFIALEYNNEVPAVKKKTDLGVSSSLATSTQTISVTNYKLEKLLPLLLYWRSTERYTIKLNPSIAVNNFSNALN